MPNFAHTKELLLDMMPEHTPMIRGQHGTGKTEMIRQICADPNGWNMKCIELQGSQLSDVGDLIGLMQIIDVTDEFGVVHKESAWITPYWFPKDGQPFCLFLDEINRAAPPIKRAMMQIGNDHKLLNFELPKGSRVVCACNPGDDGNYDVEEFDDAENDRYWHIEFTPDPDEALDYWRKSGVLPVIIEYCSRNKGDMDCYSAGKNAKVEQKKTGASGKKNPAQTSRRSWYRLSGDMKYAMDRHGGDAWYRGEEGYARLENLATGWLGPTIASNFVQFWKQYRSGITPDAILLTDDFKKFKKDIEQLAESVVDTVRFGESMVMFIMNNEDQMHSGKTVTPYGKKIAKNLNLFMRAIKPEEAVQIATTQFDKWRKSKETGWVGMVQAASPELTEYLGDLADMDI